MSDNFDTELYGNGTGDRFAGYNTSIPADGEMDVDGDDDGEDGGNAGGGREEEDRA